MEEELAKDYVRTAKAKGLSDQRILYRHVLKNSMVPVLSYMGPLCVGLLSGSAFVEILFAVPGLGNLFVESLKERDYFLSSGLVLVFGGLLLLLSQFFEWLSQKIDIRLGDSHEKVS
jgi:oligopeptide transport system permease protein